jgi:GTPase SAR1 family protein
MLSKQLKGSKSLSEVENFKPDKLKDKTRFKRTIKRHASSIISNVPIIGPGSPKPLVVEALESKKTKIITIPVVFLGDSKVSMIVKRCAVLYA